MIDKNAKFQCKDVRCAAVLVGETKRTFAHCGALGAISQQAHCLPHQFSGILYAHSAASVDRLFGGQRKIESVRADQYRFAQGAGFDQVLPAQRLQTAANEGAIAGRVVSKHLTHRITKQYLDVSIERAQLRGL